MRFLSQDPDIETIVRRIEDGDYDLQPDFQRGEVWSTQKKRRLVDSVLRGWHIPPIHFVLRADARSDVLDGQQRLTAIRDFVRGKFTVDGKIEPASEEINALDGLRYAELPPDVLRRFKKFTIRVFELVDFNPDEPHELFFRLNQPTNLTEAEKRNAFVGGARNQVRELVTWATQSGLLGPELGFSNARMAYDDLIARALLTIEFRSLDAKVTAMKLTERYRSGDIFDEAAISALKNSLQTVSPFLNAKSLKRPDTKPNKATLHTWILLGAQLASTDSLERNSKSFLLVVGQLEAARWRIPQSPSAVESRIVSMFQDRSTARVADASSVILRDIVSWMYLSKAPVPDRNLLKIQLATELWKVAEQSEDLESTLLEHAASVGWGEAGWR